MTVVFVLPLVSTAQFSRNSSLSQHSGILVMNQEERHASLSNAQMTNRALSFVVCGEVCSSINIISENVLPTAKCQKDESMKGISDKHTHGKLLNIIASWKVAHGDVIAHHALEFGQTMVKWFRKSQHSFFYDMLSKPMVAIVLCGNMLYDQEMIDERMIVMMSSNRSVPMHTCMITDIVFQQRW